MHQDLAVAEGDWSTKYLHLPKDVLCPQLLWLWASADLKKGGMKGITCAWVGGCGRTVHTCPESRLIEKDPGKMPAKMNLLKQW